MLPETLAELFKKPAITIQQMLEWKRGMMLAEVWSIRGYIESVASAFDREFKAFDAKVAEELAKLPQHLHNDIIENNTEMAFNLTEHFPAFSWQTTFVAIYSYLEAELLDLRRTGGRHIGIKLDPEDLRHTGIFAAKMYLTDLCGIAFPEQEHPWQEVLHYNPIRNVIVHSYGQLSRSKKANAIRRYAEGKISITVENFDTIKLSKEFCLEVLENVKALSSELYKLALARVS